MNKEQAEIDLLSDNKDYFLAATTNHIKKECRLATVDELE